MSGKKQDKWSEVVVLKSDLRAILFWASFGISQARSGSYRDAPNIIDSYARHIKFQGAYSPKFKKKR
jgi:hypothetical protein